MHYDTVPASMLCVCLQQFLTASNLRVVLKKIGLPCTDILLFANIKIQLTGTFEVTVKIKILSSRGLDSITKIWLACNISHYLRKVQNVCRIPPLSLEVQQYMKAQT